VVRLVSQSKGDTDTGTGLGIIFGEGGGSKEEKDCRFLSLAKPGQECECNIQIDLRKVDLFFAVIKI